MQAVVGTVAASELWGWPDCSRTLAPVTDGPHGRLEETMSMVILCERKILLGRRRRLHDPHTEHFVHNRIGPA